MEHPDEHPETHPELHLEEQLGGSAGLTARPPLIPGASRELGSPKHPGRDGSAKHMEFLYGTPYLAKYSFSALRLASSRADSLRLSSWWTNRPFVMCRE